MGYDEKMADRIRALIAAETEQVEEKRMFGGLCFMVSDQLCIGVKADSILVRLDPEVMPQAAEENGFTQMARKGKPITEYGYVSNDVLLTTQQLQHWVSLALDYNRVIKKVKKTSK